MKEKLTVVLATHNKGKISQFKHLFKKLEKHVNIKTLTDINLNDDIEETGTTYEENAYIKCKTITDKTGFIAISEDSGLSIDALNGQPGIYTARYGQGLSKKEKLESILNELKDVPQELRGASFISVICATFLNDHKISSTGVCAGFITNEIINIDGGMAYTPIFKANNSKSLALSNLTEKQLIKVNHRGIASKQFVKDFIKYIKQYKKMN